MSTEQQAFDAKCEQTITEMMPFVTYLAKGDPDLIQEATIGIWQKMRKVPDACRKYYARSAKWGIDNITRGRGSSVDNFGSWRTTQIPVVHYDADVSQAVLADRRRVPLDQWVIQKIDWERFFANLTSTEAEYIRHKVVDGDSDEAIAKMMDVSIDRIYQTRKGLRAKVEDFFSV